MGALKAEQLRLVLWSFGARSLWMMTHRMSTPAVWSKVVAAALPLFVAAFVLNAARERRGEDPVDFHPSVALVRASLMG
jgi:hypothetical protein